MLSILTKKMNLGSKSGSKSNLVGFPNCPVLPGEIKDALHYMKGRRSEEDLLNAPV